MLLFDFEDFSTLNSYSTFTTIREVRVLER